MSDGIIAEALYVCSNCGHEHSLSKDEIVFEAESGSERGMGEECQYAAYIYSQCDSCNQEIRLKFEACEYPIGILNNTNYEAFGAEILEVSIDIYHRPPEPEEDNTRVLGAAAGGAIFGASVGGPFGALIGGIIGGIIGNSVKDGGKKNG